MSVRRAKNLHARFSGHKGEEIGTIDIPDSDVVAIIGELDGLLYSTVRDGKQESYVHQFQKRCRPTLAVSADGKRIYIIGGKFKFTAKGFEDNK